MANEELEKQKLEQEIKLLAAENDLTAFEKLFKRISPMIFSISAAIAGLWGFIIPSCNYINERAKNETIKYSTQIIKAVDELGLPSQWSQKKALTILQNSGADAIEFVLIKFEEDSLLDGTAEFNRVLESIEKLRSNFSSKNKKSLHNNIKTKSTNELNNYIKGGYIHSELLEKYITLNCALSKFDSNYTSTLNEMIKLLSDSVNLENDNNKRLVTKIKLCQ